MQFFSVLSSLACKLSFRVTDIGIKHVVENCKQIVDLNLSGCKVLDSQIECYLFSYMMHIILVVIKNKRHVIVLYFNGFVEMCCTLCLLSFFFYFTGKKATFLRCLNFTVGVSSQTLVLCLPKCAELLKTCSNPVQLFMIVSCA
jgi:hypothetical protein